MIHRRQRTYRTIFFLCVAGYAWLAWNLSPAREGVATDSLCPTKHLTGLPCPGCGTTRSVVSILHGDFSGALLYNPLGYLVVAGLLVLPLWMAADLLTRRASLLEAYRRTEQRLQRRRWALPLMVFLLINWCWNIAKGL